MRHARLKSWNEVRAIVRRREREVLIVRPPAAPDGPWEFPGGRLYAREPATVGLQRLCRSILGREVDTIGSCVRSSHGFAFHVVEYRYYLCDLDVAHEPRVAHHEVRWVLIPQLRDYFFDAPTQFVVDRLLEALHK